jgi:hypothetical protein
VSNSIAKNVEKVFTVIMKKLPILVQPKTESLIADIGQTLILNCKLENSTKIRVSWKKNENRIRTDKNKLMWDNQFQLMSILNLSKSDEGRYKCEAENSNGKVYKEFVLTVKGIYAKY